MYGVALWALAHRVVQHPETFLGPGHQHAALPRGHGALARAREGTKPRGDRANLNVRTIAAPSAYARRASSAQVGSRSPRAPFTPSTRRGILNSWAIVGRSVPRGRRATRSPTDRARGEAVGAPRPTPRTATAPARGAARASSSPRRPAERAPRTRARGDEPRWRRLPCARAARPRSGDRVGRALATRAVSARWFPVQ